MISDEQYYSISDRAHFLAGICVVFGANIVGCTYMGAAIVIVFAIVKEGFIDPKEETPEVAGSGYRDFAGYLLGTISALAGLLLCGKL